MMSKKETTEQQQLKDRIEQEAADWYANQMGENPDKAGFAQWRLASPAHAEAYQAFELLYDGAGLLSKDVDIVAELAKIPNKVEPAPSQARPNWFKYATAAAIMAVTVLTMLFVQSLPQEQYYATNIGQRQVVLLDDGSEVTLDADSKLKVSFSGRQRDIELLHGRARFNVAKDPNRPFVVSSHIGSVRAVGTLFDVNKRHEALDVALLEGIVEVGLRRDPDKKLQMTAGQQTSLSVVTTTLMVSPFPVIAKDWTKGMLIFEATPLSEAIMRINRYLKKPLRIDDPEVAQLTVTGHFSTQSPEKIITALTSMFAVELESTATGLLLKPAAQ